MIDKAHVDYKTYEKEFCTLIDECNKELGQYGGKSTLNSARRDGVISHILKKYSTLIKELQKKYAHLFIE